MLQGQNEKNTIKHRTALIFEQGYLISYIQLTLLLQDNKKQRVDPGCGIKKASVKWWINTFDFFHYFAAFAHHTV